ncbi:enhanced intracellular survival protein Eis [Paenibacillus solisilvae]|uniref:Enhanced intracellular survival protein Eis n=1 Tax=Paenibacillus solisilvae TaxID=2486751 RepID=A0ABW0W413_9BACL
MELRQLIQEEFKSSIKLSSFAFQYEVEEQRLKELEKRFKPEQTWGFFEENSLIAKMSIIPFDTYIGGKVFAMGGIAGVATWPEYRRQGLVAKLLEHGLRLMKTNGQSISFLYPFAFNFYRKYGWETYTDYKKYTIETSHFPERKSYSGTILRIGNEWGILDELYQAYASNYNGTLVRNQDWWNYNVLQKKESQVVVYYDETKQAQGYLIYNVKDQEMTVHEMVYVNELASDALWTFIANHDSMILRAVLKAPSNDQLPFKLSNPRIKQEVIPYFMARIVDVEAFLKEYPIHDTGEKDTFLLEVVDTFAPWNQGKYEWTMGADGQTQISRSTSDVVDITMDVQTLTTLMLGYQSAAFLQQIGRLKCSESLANRLNQRLAIRQTYNMDFF